MRTIIPLLVAALLFGTLDAAAQRKGTKSKTPAAQKAPEPTPEELAALEREAEQQRRVDELLPSTRSVTFIDSLVADKDNFLPYLRLTNDAGRYTDPQALFADHNAQYVTGSAVFVNSLASAVYFSVADSTGNVTLHAAYRNADHWGTPQPLRGVEGQDYQDYPFMLSDGTTLYYAAQSSDGLGGLDLYVTRYSSASRQFVRPENLGFPFNSTGNDYLLAIDESCGVGVLVTDRRQPDDKVCIYWFIAEDNYPTVPYDEDDDDSIAEVRSIAAIESIAATQHDEARIAEVRRIWQSALGSQQALSAAARSSRFVINDATVYTALSDFVSDEAREQAALWESQSQQLSELQSTLDDLRRSYATSRSQKQAQQIRNLEVQVVELQHAVSLSAKAFRKTELQAVGGR